MIKEFRQFILRGNLVDLAVAVVLGTAFGLVVNSLVENLITPLIALIVGEPDFSDLAFTISDTRFGYGQFLTDALTFATVAAAVFFFVVKPVNALMERFTPTKESDTRDCPECLSEIPKAAARCAHCTASVGPAT